VFQKNPTILILNKNRTTHHFFTSDILLERGKMEILLFKRKNFIFL